jgi:hypothetical protein
MRDGECFSCCQNAKNSLLCPPPRSPKSQNMLLVLRYLLLLIRITYVSRDLFTTRTNLWVRTDSKLLNRHCFMYSSKTVSTDYLRESSSAETTTRPMYGGFFGLPGTSAAHKLLFFPECSISYVSKSRSRSLPYSLLLSPSAPGLTRSSSMFALAGSSYRDIETLLLLSRSPGSPQHHLHTKSSWLITLVGIHSSLEGISLTSNSFLVLCSCHSCRTHLVLELAAAGECALMRALNGFALFETHVMQGKTPSTKSKSKVMVRMSLECHCVVAVRLSSERVVDARALAISFPTATRPPAIDRAANIVTRLWPCF